MQRWPIQGATGGDRLAMPKSTADWDPLPLWREQAWRSRDWRSREEPHEALSGIRPGVPVSGGLLPVARDHLPIGLLGRFPKCRRSEKAVFRIRDDAAIQLSVRAASGADDRSG